MDCVLGGGSPAWAVPCLGLPTCSDRRQHFISRHGGRHFTGPLGCGCECLLEPPLSRAFGLGAQNRGAVEILGDSFFTPSEFCGLRGSSGVLSLLFAQLAQRSS